MDECYVGSQQLSQDTEFDYETFEMRYLRETDFFVFDSEYKMLKNDFLQHCATQGTVDWEKYKTALLSMHCICKDDIIVGLQFTPPPPSQHPKLAFLNKCSFGQRFKMPKIDLISICAEHGIFDWNVIHATLETAGCKCVGNIIYGIEIQPANLQVSTAPDFDLPERRQRKRKINT